MRAQEEKRDRDPRPAFDCEMELNTGIVDDQCVREYLRSHMPLAV